MDFEGVGRFSMVEMKMLFGWILNSQEVTCLISLCANLFFLSNQQVSSLANLGGFPSLRFYFENNVKQISCLSLSISVTNESTSLIVKGIY